jgi:hypothetical protein
MQISRIRLSDKTSRLHPRHVVPKPAQAHEPEVPVKVREWIRPALASPDLVPVLRHLEFCQSRYQLGGTPPRDRCRSSSGRRQPYSRVENRSLAAHRQRPAQCRAAEEIASAVPQLWSERIADWYASSQRLAALRDFGLAYRSTIKAILDRPNSPRGPRHHADNSRRRGPRSTPPIEHNIGGWSSVSVPSENRDLYIRVN